MSGYRMTARGVFALACVLYAWVAMAQPQLTTIQDTVYLADGRLFQGAVTVEYRSFLAADYTNVAAYNKNTRIVNGLLKISLVPTTTASVGAYYIARYVVNGRVQFTEYWAVPPSTSLLKLRDVRLAAPPLAGQTQAVPPGSLGTVQITDVIGLPDELAARARKGLAYVPSRVAVINSGGDLDGAIGEPTDCVRVNGTTGPCNVNNSPSFIDGETPAGLINGSNVTFTLANPPNPASSLALYRNGLLQEPGVDFDLSTNTVTFFSESKPQPGDSLKVSYRISSASGQTGGQAGGSLTGYFPAPSIAPGAIANQHIADNAAIAESKLALNYPTHSNASDPSSDQKAALAGTSGAPSSTNRFVTDADSRLTNARQPTNHALLSSAHFDTNPGSVGRGDLIIGAGTAPSLWTRLPLGAANRCLISNGFDAVWNACLFTGYPTGAVPFVDSTGILAHNQSRFFWDNSARRLAIGNNSPTASLSVHDASTGSGVTSVHIRAGDAQASTPLQSWQDASGADVARLESNGVLVASNVSATSSSVQAAWQETGTSSDPSAATNGAMWFNTTEAARKSREAGQAHSQPQVVCSIAGTATSSLTPVSLGTCRIPAAMVRTGDRFEVSLEMSHDGGATAGFSYTLSWGGVVLSARGFAAVDSGATARITAVPQSNNIYWSWQNWGNVAALQAGNGNSSFATGDVLVVLQGQLSSSAVETATLRNLSVVRYPAQQNN
ncbi:MAG: hypothetical protein HY820_46105 [Acidobacteria bacterium]|nr:hypothetical protein [Acidobacteriota bacterium]